MILHSILLSRAWGKAYYYPGYAYLEPSEYDYKKRLGALEYFDWRGHWLEFEDNPALTHPHPNLALE
jgi:arginine-tRNA-protein transferase